MYVGKPWIITWPLVSNFAGAGKTTLMDILAGRRSGEGVTGRIHLNGTQVGHMFKRIASPLESHIL